MNAEVGDTVEWINKDALVHTATATNGDWNVNIPASHSGQVVTKKRAQPTTTASFIRT